MPEVANDAAHLVDPFSIEEMHIGFTKVIHDDEYRNKLIERGFDNSKRFSNSIIARQFSEIYEVITK